MVRPGLFGRMPEAPPRRFPVPGKTPPPGGGTAPGGPCSRPGGGQAFCGQDRLGPGFPGSESGFGSATAPAAGSSTGRRRRCPPSARPGNGAGSGLQQLSPGVKDQHQGVVDHRQQGISLRRRGGDSGALQMGTDAFPGQGLQPDGPELPGEAGQEAPARRTGRR